MAIAGRMIPLVGKQAWLNRGTVRTIRNVVAALLAVESISAVSRTRNCKNKIVSDFIFCKVTCEKK
jgi:hypothetical protein